MAAKNHQIIDDLEKALISSGWVKDRWKNFKKTINSKEYRIKVQKISVRLEVKAAHAGWVRLRSSYIKDITIDENGIHLGGIVLKNN